MEMLHVIVVVAVFNFMSCISGKYISKVKDKQMNKQTNKQHKIVTNNVLNES